MVTAASRDGQTGTATLGYTVVGKAPQVLITAPVANAAYLWTALPAADFDCLAGLGSTVQSCKATVAGQPVSDHQALPNGFGVHTLTVTATDADGLSTTASATYTVTSSVSLAPVSIEVPAQGAKYRLGQVVAARYSCLAPTTGPALKSCVGNVRGGPAHQHADAGPARVQRLGHQRPGRLDDGDGLLPGRSDQQPHRRHRRARRTLGRGSAPAHTAGARRAACHRHRMGRRARRAPAPRGLRHRADPRPPRRTARRRHRAERRRPVPAACPRCAARSSRSWSGIRRPAPSRA